MAMVIKTVKLQGQIVLVKYCIYVSPEDDMIGLCSCWFSQLVIANQFHSNEQAVSSLHAKQIQTAVLSQFTIYTKGVNKSLIKYIWVVVIHFGVKKSYCLPLCSWQWWRAPNGPTKHSRQFVKFSSEDGTNLRRAYTANVRFGRPVACA